MQCCGKYVLSCKKKMLLPSNEVVDVVVVVVKYYAYKVKSAGRFFA